MMASDHNNWTNTTDHPSPVNRLFTWSVTQIKTAWLLLEYSSAYLATLAALEVIMVQLLLSLPVTLAPIVVGLTTFAIYANDRLVDLTSDAISNPQRTEFARQYQGVLYVAAAIAYGIAVTLSVLGGPLALGLTLIPGIAWVLYAVDWVPTGNTPFYRLKEIIVVNSAIIAVAWSVTIVFLPIAFAGSTITPETWVVFGYLTLGTFICAEISNARDIKSDIESNVSTLPVVLGVHRTKHVLYGISLLMAVMVSFSTMSGYLTIISAVALLIGLGSLISIISLLGRDNIDQSLSVAAEFTRMPVLAILFFASHLF